MSQLGKNSKSRMTFTYGKVRPEGTEGYILFEGRVIEVVEEQNTGSLVKMEVSNRTKQQTN